MNDLTGRRRLLKLAGGTTLGAILGAIFPEVAWAAGSPKKRRTNAEEGLPWTLDGIVEEHPASQAEMAKYRSFLAEQTSALRASFGGEVGGATSMVVSINALGRTIVRSGTVIGESDTLLYSFELDDGRNIMRSNLELWRHDFRNQESELIAHGTSASSLQTVTARSAEPMLNCPPGTYVQLRCEAIRSWDCLYTACGTYSWPCSWAMGVNLPAAIACLMVTCAWGVQTCCTRWVQYCAPA